MKLSIVSTLYNSPDEVPELIDRCVKVARDFAGDDFEIVLIDDACPQHSADIAEEHGRGISQLRVVRLARNFGQHHALMEGFRQSQGEFVFALDGDLEEEPEWLIRFHRELQETGSDVVYGFQRPHRRGLFDAIQGYVGYGVIKGLTGLSFKPNLVTARLMRRDYVDALCSFTERSIWLAGLWDQAGFTQLAIQVEKARLTVTNYDFRAKLSQLLNAVLTFSNKPLRMVFGFGLLGSAGAIVAVGIAVVRGLSGDVLDGWASMLASIWILGGALLFSTSILAYYVGVIFIEVKSRPSVIVRKPMN